MSTIYPKIYRFKKVKSDEIKKVFLNNEEPDFHILTDPNYVEVVSQSIQIEIPDSDINGFIAAKIIFNSLKETGGIPQHLNDLGLWEWLSYAFQAHLKKPGDKPYLELYSYLPEMMPPIGDYKKYMNHLMRTATYLYYLFEDKAEVYLSGPLREHGEILEQFTQTYPMVQENIADLLKILYWDDETKSLKRGAANKKDGDLRHLLYFLKYLRQTQYIEAMSANEIIELLPSIYHSRWL